LERAEQFIGQSYAFLDAVERASRAAPLNRPVLVIGERGTGKELIAERLHHLSSRWAGPLIIMNCAALPENLIEAELFGHEAGSFTGAAKTRHGRFEEADGGTLFLDELGTLSMPAQDRLLRATEYGEITRIGASKPISVDVRIVAATNENLPAQVDKGKFRADLLDRLSFEVITLPPLRAREGDVPLLTEHFGRRMSVELDWPNWPGFSPRRGLGYRPTFSLWCRTMSHPVGRRPICGRLPQPFRVSRSFETGAALKRSGLGRRPPDTVSFSPRTVGDSFRVALRLLVGMKGRIPGRKLSVLSSLPRKLRLRSHQS